MKTLLRNTVLLTLFIASTTVNAQINVTFDPTPTTIYSDGTLENPIIITLSNVPYGYASSVSINTRVYNSGTSVSGGGHVTSLSISDFNLDEAFADVDTGTIKTETTLNTPSANFFTRVYTIKKYPAGTINTISSADIAIRFVGAFSASPALTFVQTPESGGSANNASFKLNTGLTVSSSLSSKDFSSIASKIYPNPVTSIKH
ncbi:hypothetical protein VOI54_06020 [Tamlana sp. 2201CG12-4]|uniref:hypothetical protein n=1 Tax=Tamlana sp. 2201CG12-4 TaxID=3112582 RepID=UPI002DB64DD9|nr:hypothetical protein [Tamlana sp. 2201CG12-4]MEC3906566.1 hypothetical protein [Tamlana sp. 2201CG12-4]